MSYKQILILVDNRNITVSRNAIIGNYPIDISNTTINTVIEKIEMGELDRPAPDCTDPWTNEPCKDWVPINIYGTSSEKILIIIIGNKLKDYENGIEEFSNYKKRRSGLSDVEESLIMKKIEVNTDGKWNIKWYISKRLNPEFLYIYNQDGQFLSSASF